MCNVFYVRIEVQNFQVNPDGLEEFPREGRLLLKEVRGWNERLYVRPPGQNKIEIFESNRANKLSDWLKDIFLPQGYPASVSADYMEYQIFDTAQAFCSSITGILATKEVLRGVGVGDVFATPLAATITWVLKDGCGHIGRIVFAYTNGKYLDAYCKTWRLFADVMNDFAMLVELTLPMYGPFTTVALCWSTVFKAVVGVAGGATRTALTQHHAIRNNLADVSAKDAAQETAVNLIASMVAVYIMSYFGTSIFLFFLLMLAHLIFNYCAVKSVCLDTFNPARYMLALDAVLRSEQFLSVNAVNCQEPVFYMLGVKGFPYNGFTIRMGTSAKNILTPTNSEYFEKMVDLYGKKKFIPIMNLNTRVVDVMLNRTIGSEEFLEAYFHSILYILATLAVNDLPIPFQELNSIYNEAEWAMIPSDIGFTSKLSYDGIKFMEHLASSEWIRVSSGFILAGWDLTKHQLMADEWRVSYELVFDDEDDGDDHYEPPIELGNPLPNFPNAISRWDYQYMELDSLLSTRVIDSETGYQEPGPSGNLYEFYTNNSDIDDNSDYSDFF